MAVVQQTAQSAASARLSKRAWLMRFCAIVGPGLIVMVGDNDVGAFSVYTSAGAHYGTALLWVMLLLLPITYFCQEMVIRLGCATGEGHAAMIFRRFGAFWGWFSFVDLLIVNFATIVSEFIGITAGLNYFGLPMWAGALVSIALLFLMVSTGAYKRWENAALILVIFNLMVIPPVIALHPNYLEASTHYFRVQFPGGVTPDLVFLIIGMVGTTIAPWQIFFQQSAIADKGLRIRDIPMARYDLALGNVFVQVGAFALIVLGSILFHGKGVTMTDPMQVAHALNGQAGYLEGAFYSIALINAGLIGGVANALANAWALGEVTRTAATLNRKVAQAPVFYACYVLCLGIAAAITLIPQAPLQLITNSVQVLAGIILPVTLVFLNLLLNDVALLGPNLANRPWQNWVNWSIIALLFALSGVLVAQTLAPNLFPQTGS